jgi:hypothetical protein
MNAAAPVNLLLTLFSYHNCVLSEACFYKPFLFAMHERDSFRFEQEQKDG